MEVPGPFGVVTLSRNGKPPASWTTHGNFRGSPIKPGVEPLECQMRTSILPVLAPRIMERNASTVFSTPSTIVSS